MPEQLGGGSHYIVGGATHERNKGQHRERAEASGRVREPCDWTGDCSPEDSSYGMLVGLFVQPVLDVLLRRHESYLRSNGLAYSGTGEPPRPTLKHWLNGSGTMNTARCLTRPSRDDVVCCISQGVK